jgi:hypothetical protein
LWTVCSAAAAASELNADYFRDGVSYLRAVEVDQPVPTLFDALEIREAAA